MGERLVYNEGKACDAILRRLEAREGQRRQRVRLPEKERHPHPIELACHIGPQLFAIEHTGIEPFAGHMELDGQSSFLIDPICQMLAGKLPADDWFELGIPLHAFRNMTGKPLAETQSALAAWVEATAPTVPRAPFGTYLRSIAKARPPGVPFDVRLDRFESLSSGRLVIKHTVGPELEQLREERLRAALTKKLPKLEAWRNDEGARTVLILEDNDISLTNPERVFQALAKVETEFANKAAEVYLLGTYAQPWYVHALRIGDRNYYELSRAGRCLTEVDPAILTDVTERG